MKVKQEYITLLKSLEKLQDTGLLNIHFVETPLDISQNNVQTVRGKMYIFINTDETVETLSVKLSLADKLMKGLIEERDHKQSSPDLITYLKSNIEQ